MRLDGKTAIVTGAASGIGRAIAQRLGEAGARIIVADIDRERAAATAATLGAGHLALAVDVADEASVEAMVGEAVRLAGAVHVLVNSAGIGMHRPFLDLTLADWRRVHDVNLTGTFLTCRAVARHMRDGGHGGSLITMASAAGIRSSSATAAYASTKGGVLAFTRGIAIDLAPHGIRANAICPGPIATELVEKAHSPAMRKAFEDRVALGRYARPEEVAGAALYLACDEASFVTGSAIAVDGGFVGSGVIVR